MFTILLRRGINVLFLHVVASCVCWFYYLRLSGRYTLNRIDISSTWSLNKLVTLHQGTGGHDVSRNPISGNDQDPEAWLVHVPAA